MHQPQHSHSWFYRNGFYYTLLALVLLLHAILLAIKFRQDLEVSLEDMFTPPIKLRIVDPSTINRQIVESADSVAVDKPKDGAYLSDKDRSFDRQTRARTIAPFNQGGGGAVAKSAPAQSGVKTSAKGTEGLSLGDLGAFSKGHDPMKVAAQEYTKKINSGSRGSGRGISSSNDFVEGIPLGDLTYLNTVEYKYFGFFHRIKQKLEQFWGRSIQETAEGLFKKGRQLATEENLTTSLKVTMNHLGEILSVTIKGSSGVRELDDAAIESFNQAGPFPNPPKGLIVNGKVEIEWGFIVNT